MPTHIQGSWYYPFCIMAHILTPSSSFRFRWPLRCGTKWAQNVSGRNPQALSALICFALFFCRCSFDSHVCILQSEHIYPLLFGISVIWSCCLSTLCRHNADALWAFPSLNSQFITLTEIEYSVLPFFKPPFVSEIIPFQKVKGYTA